MLVQGIDWAIENHAKGITMSVTGADVSSALANTVTLVQEEYGIVLVAAFANGFGGGFLNQAEYGPVIGVGSINRDFNHSSFSLIGCKVESVAPGSSVMSTWPGDRYKVLSGTSLAAPFVTGAIALILGANQKLWNSIGLTN